MDFAERFRPKSPNQLLGDKQKQIATNLIASVDAGNINQMVLFSGPSGVGKTTIARMYLRQIIGDVDIDSNVTLINGSADNKIDDIRDLIIGTMQWGMLSEIKYRVYLINEIHRFTIPAQEALLEPFEPPPSHVIVIATTTNPEKLKNTLVSRFTEYKLPPIEKGEFRKKAGWIEAALNRDNDNTPKFNTEDIDSIIDSCGGNVRLFDKRIGQLVDGTYVGYSLDEEDDKGLLFAIFFQKKNQSDWFGKADELTDYYGTAIGLCGMAIKVFQNPMKYKHANTQKVAGLVLKHFGTGLSPYTSERVAFYHKLLLVFNGA